MDDFHLSGMVIVQQQQEPDDSLQRTYTLDGAILDLGEPVIEQVYTIIHYSVYVCVCVCVYIVYTC